MSKLLVKYWAGSLSVENMETNPEWLNKWIELAEIEKQNNMELVVFRLPKQPNGHADIEDIERFLQEKYGA